MVGAQERTKEAVSGLSAGSERLCPLLKRCSRGMKRGRLTDGSRLRKGLFLRRGPGAHRYVPSGIGSEVDHPRRLAGIVTNPSNSADHVSTTKATELNSNAVMAATNNATK